MDGAQAKVELILSNNFKVLGFVSDGISITVTSHVTGFSIHSC